MRLRRKRWEDNRLADTGDRTGLEATSGPTGLEPEKRRRRIRGGHAAVAAVTAALLVSIGGVAACACSIPQFIPGGGGGGGPFNGANIYLDPNGSDSCGPRSASLISYSTAASSGKVCKTWQEACDVATGGDIVGVKTGTYGAPNVPAEYIRNTDCSDGLGNTNVDPTAGQNPSNWVTFQCADGETADTVSTALNGFNLISDLHIRIQGGCFYLHVLSLGLGVPIGNFTKDIWIEGSSASNRLHLDGVDVSGARYIRLHHVSMGPAVYCTATGLGPTANQCNTGGAAWGTFESQWAGNTQGWTSADCASNTQHCGGSASQQLEPFIHAGAAGETGWVEWDDVWAHDQNTKNAGPYHGGCLLTNNTGAGPVVLNGFVCERVAIQGIQSELDNLTVQNSTFGCSTLPLDQTTNWADCAGAGTGYSYKISRSGVSNNLIRYNTYLTGSGGITLGGVSHSNFRLIGNVFDGTAVVDCTNWSTAAYNVGVNGSAAACGTNGQTLSGNPIVDDNAGNAYSTSTQINAHLTGSPAVQTVPNAGTDYSLGSDADELSRSYPTSAGAFR